jgi:hypothetical protein
MLLVASDMHTADADREKPTKHNFIQRRWQTRLTIVFLQIGKTVTLRIVCNDTLKFCDPLETESRH